MRALFTPLGDLRAELTLIGRYVLAELDRETELVRLLALDARGGPAGLAAVAQQLTDASFSGFAGWLAERADPPLDDPDALAAAALGSLLSSRLLRDVFGVTPRVEDAALVDAWVTLVQRGLARS